MSGRGLPAYKPPITDESPLDVQETHVAPGNVIHIDAATGHVGTENADGSITVGPVAKPRSEKLRERFDANLAEDPGIPAQTICQRLLEGIDADIKSRADWEETANRGRDLLGVKLDAVTGEVGSSGTVADTKNLAYLEAIVRSWANSRAELLPANGPVKVQDDLPGIDKSDGEEQQDPQQAGAAPLTGHNKPPTRSELADALEADFNRYLTVTDKEYYPDTSRMLLNRAVNGVQFKKIYRDPILRRPVSRWVRGDNLIVSNDTSHLSGAGRVTERIPMRQSVVKRLQKIGHWLDVSLTMPTQTPTATDQTIADIEGTQTVPSLPADQLHTIYECYCELDDGSLAHDETGHVVGWPLPYRVTIDKDSQKVLEIRRNWKMGDTDYMPRRRYVKYGFVPGLGFYDWGFVHILGNPQRATSAMANILIDAGMFNSFPGGLMAKGPGAARNRTTQIRPKPGEFAVVDTGGQKIQDVAMPLPYKEPSAVLQSEKNTMSQDMRRMAGVLEMPVGEGRIGNTPVGTIMAYVDQITKVPSAIHKDDHAAQSEEFELLKELFEEEPEALIRGMKRPARKDGYTEQELRDADLVPQADPNIPSQTHRIMQKQALIEAATQPIFQGIANPRELWAQLVRILGADDPSLTLPPQPPQAAPPDPRVVAAQLSNQGKQVDAAAKTHVADVNAEVKREEMAAEERMAGANNQSTEKREGMKLLGQTAKVKSDLTAKGAQIASDLHQHAVSEGLDHLQHTQKLAQADRHKAVDAATAAQEAANTDDQEPT